MTDDDIINYWAEYQTAEHCTPGTIHERTIFVRAFLRRQNTTLTTATRQHLIRDLGRQHADGRPLSAKTKQNYRSLFHTLFTWMQDESIRTDNPAARLPRTRVPHQEPNPLTTDEIQHLLDSGIYGKTRLYALLYAYQAFRAVEIAAVSGESIDWDRQRILSKDGKGGKEVWRPIHPIVWAELQKYPRSGPLFPSPNGGHVSRKNVSNVLSKALKRAGIVGHRPHQMRTWHAVELLDQGVDSWTVQWSMRHTDPNSMKHYGLIRDQRIADAMALLPTVRVPEKAARKRAA